MKRARRSLRLFSWRRAASSAAAPGRASGLRAWMPAPRLGFQGASSDELSIEDSPGNNSQTMPESAVPVLASYIPAALVLQYCGVELGPKGVEQGQQLEPPAQPVRSDFNGAIGFIDVSGFTALSEKLAQERGRGGAELLNQYMNRYFERLIDVIALYSGDVVKFAGDALQVLWSTPSTAASRDASGERGAAVSGVSSSTA